MKHQILQHYHGENFVEYSAPIMPLRVSLYVATASVSHRKWLRRARALVSPPVKGNAVLQSVATSVMEMCCHTIFGDIRSTQLRYYCKCVGQRFFFKPQSEFARLLSSSIERCKQYIMFDYFFPCVIKCTSTSDDIY